MGISAQVIADSISSDNIRLLTLKCRLPWTISPELLRHRVFSFSSGSGRAIPALRLIEDVESDPFIPIWWGKNQPGMQAHEEHDAPVVIMSEEDLGPGEQPWEMPRDDAWRAMAEDSIEWARRWAEAGYHKQIVNRIIAPYSHISVLITGTQWSNFLALRDHPDAEPHIRVLACEIRSAMHASKPKLLQPGQWHMPFILAQDTVDAVDHLRNVQQIEPTDKRIEGLLLKVSTARCARLSYQTRDGHRSKVEEDLALYERLVGAHPIHASPAEHQATPDRWIDPRYEWWEEGHWESPHLHGNLTGFIQHRKLLPNECL